MQIRVYVASAYKGNGEAHETKVFVGSGDSDDLGLLEAKNWIKDQIIAYTGSLSDTVEDDPFFDEEEGIEEGQLEVTAPWLSSPCLFTLEPQYLEYENYDFDESGTIENLRLRIYRLIADDKLPQMNEEQIDSLALDVTREMDPIYDPYQYILIDYLSRSEQGK